MHDGIIHVGGRCRRKSATREAGSGGTAGAFDVHRSQHVLKLRHRRECKKGRDQHPGEHRTLGSVTRTHHAEDPIGPSQARGVR